MRKSKKLNSLVKSVQFFVKKCREQNQKLLTMSSLDETNDAYASESFADAKIYFDKSCKAHSVANSSKGSSDSKYGMYRKCANTRSNKLRRAHTQGSFHNLCDYQDNEDGKKFTGVKKGGEEMGIKMGGEISQNIGNKMGDEIGDETEAIGITDQIAKMTGVEASKEDKSKDTKMDNIKTDDIKNEMIAYDLHLLNLYKKLESSSKNSKLIKKNKIKKTKTLRTCNSEVLRIKNELYLRRNNHNKEKTKISNNNKIKDKMKNKVKNKMKDKKKKKKMVNNNSEEKNELTQNISLDSQKLKSKSSFLTPSENFSKYHNIDYSKKKTLDGLYFFQEGLSNRLNKKSNTSSYDIGCMYMNNYASAKSSKELTKKKKSNDIILLKNSSTKSFRRFKFLNDNKKNIEYYKNMIENLEGAVGSTSSRYKKKNNTSSIDSIIKIINCLLHDYVPKLIDRYEYYMNTLDDRNKLLKQKMKESLDFGDIQYEEIRELKAQLIQKNNENKKLNETIDILKDKMLYINELELKNAEYLDEIMLMKSRVTYLEKILEENDQSKESQELRKMRRNLRKIYKNMKKEMKYITTLKSKYVNKYKKRKFYINKWIHLREKMEDREIPTYEDAEEDAELLIMDTLRSGSKCASREKVDDEGGENKGRLQVSTAEQEELADGVKTLEKCANECAEKYADKCVGTSEIYTVLEMDDQENSELLFLKEQKVSNYKRKKVTTKDKKINTILSNYTFVELMKKEERSNRKAYHNICTLIPKESYPYYHYFYSNVLLQHKSNRSNRRNRHFPIRCDEGCKYIAPEKAVIENETYLSLCRKLKECFYEQYFYKCDGETSGDGCCGRHCSYDNVVDDNGYFNHDGNTLSTYNKFFQSNKMCDILPDQARKTHYWKYMNKEDGSFCMVEHKNGDSKRDNEKYNNRYSNMYNNGDNNADTRKNKYRKLPFDCCYKVDRILSGKINCSLWGSETICGDGKDSTSCKKENGARKKSNISNNSSLINKKSRTSKRNNLFSNRDTPKCNCNRSCSRNCRCKYKYYYRVCPEAGAHEHNNNKIENDNSNSILAGILSGNRNKHTYHNSMTIGNKNDRECDGKNGTEVSTHKSYYCYYKKMDANCVNNRNDNNNRTTNVDTAARENKTSANIICDEHKSSVSKKNILMKEGGEKDIFLTSACNNERVNNFKKFLTLCSFHFVKNKSTKNLNNIFDHPEGERVQLNNVTYNKDAQTQLKNKHGEDHPNNNNIIRSNNTRNNYNVCQVNNYYNCYNVHPSYSVHNANDNYNVHNNLIIPDSYLGNRDNTGYEHFHNLNTSIADKAIKKKIKVNSELIIRGNYPNENIITDEWSKHISHMRAPYIQSKEPFYKGCNEYTTSDALCPYIKTLRYHNSFNQYLDIDTQKFDAINRYLRDHFLYTQDV
ncbi:conserved Plasmodium protein, unknown function [Plasmodium malariae]|uniref:Liprin-beta-1/2 coiled-coil domain-containing protein n=1 Tax=Plasmodium malariae TaxID=5858 RepID=A0A1D3JIV9_PLAMA|nr:conserved Plasmodium protein, unknown function [Plasmodium malariae]SBT86287.1 conserved Plasmodium protein, unknown function [Plasmodium malariae]